MYGRGPPPGYGAPPGGYGSPNGGGAGYGRGPPGGGYGGGGPSGPRHAGLGSHGAPSNLPSRPPHLPSAPGGGYGSPAGSSGSDAAGGAAGALGMQPAQGPTFSLFVGSIVDGLENGWLERILGVAGPVASFRRPTPAFAFVEYSEAESVLRCLEVVNGATIKTKAGADKALLVKADEKTRARLDEYEKDRVQNQDSADLTQQAKDDLANILARIAAGDPVTSDGDGSDPTVRREARIPQHLKDLAPEDLPESHRNNTLSSIAQFREAAVKRAQARHELDRQIEERRQAMIVNNARQQTQQRHGLATSPPGPAPAGSGASPTPPSAPAAQDPQSFNRPVAFVAGGANGQEAPLVPLSELEDAKRERERAEREHRQSEAMYRNRERQFEARERSRIAAWEREQARERNVADQEDRERSHMSERLATWDDDREADRGRELFYTDRVRWRAQRRPARLREQEADARDRAAEAAQLAAVNAQSDAFLSQHADLFASSLPSNNTDPAAVGENGAASAQGGNATPAAGVKLSFTTAPKPAAAEAPKARPTALALEDEDEGARKKRELIPLEYSDDEGEKPRLSRSEADRKAREIEGKVPTDKAGLWAWKVRWKRASEDMVKRKIAPYANKLIVEYLGDEEAELLNVVTEYLRDHKTPQDLVDELEAVLDEDATDFVVKVWRRLVLETEFAQAGIDF
ncbi:Snu71p [Rhodotorula paludigena]|uniref:Snu71p n=1 Tax=Rhodotorula paludigena TaxID=86838 RepID=UPI00317B8922